MALADRFLLETGKQDKLRGTGNGERLTGKALPEWVLESGN